MRIFEQFKKLNFYINWKLITIGYRGYAYIPLQITKQDICKYALEMLESMETDYDLIAQLILMENDDYEFNEILDKLVKSENADFDAQVRKWRVFLVGQELKNLSKDYFEGLMSLTELWVSLGLPNGCPHIIQGQYNSYSPQEYYTKDMYELAVKKNLDWIEHEVKTIISLESLYNKR